MERPSDEGARSVRKNKYFPVQTEQTRLIRLLLYGFWFIFFLCLQRCVRLQMLPFTLHLNLLFRFMFTAVRHSFASLIDKQLSRKATLMFQDVLLFEHFLKNIPNTHNISSKSIAKFSRQKLLVRKKSVQPTHSARRAIRFYLDLSATNQRAP